MPEINRVDAFFCFFPPPLQLPLTIAQPTEEFTLPAGTLNGPRAGIAIVKFFVEDREQADVISVQPRKNPRARDVPNSGILQRDTL